MFPQRFWSQILGEQPWLNAFFEREQARNLESHVMLKMELWKMRCLKLWALIKGWATPTSQLESNFKITLTKIWGAVENRIVSSLELCISEQVVCGLLGYHFLLQYLLLSYKLQVRAFFFYLSCYTTYCSLYSKVIIGLYMLNWLSI